MEQYKNISTLKLISSRDEAGNVRTFIFETNGLTWIAGQNQARGARGIALEDEALLSSPATLCATLRRGAPKDQNPVALTGQNLLDVVHLFAKNCAVCHGSAKGDASASPIAKGFYPKPPQLATDGVEDDPEGESFWKIKHGIRLTGMPSFGHALSDQQIWSLALLLKHMDKLPPGAQQAWQRVRN